MGKLTTEGRRSLIWLSRQSDLRWGGIYDRHGKGDETVRALIVAGYIEGVAQEIRMGRAVFGGGYRITHAGRAAIGAEP